MPRPVDDSLERLLFGAELRHDPPAPAPEHEHEPEPAPAPEPAAADKWVTPPALLRTLEEHALVSTLALAPGGAVHPDKTAHPFLRGDFRDAQILQLSEATPFSQSVQCHGVSTVCVQLSPADGRTLDVSWLTTFNAPGEILIAQIYLAHCPLLMGPVDAAVFRSPVVFHFPKFRCDHHYPVEVHFRPGTKVDAGGELPALEITLFGAPAKSPAELAMQWRERALLAASEPLLSQGRETAKAFNDACAAQVAGQAMMQQAQVGRAKWEASMREANREQRERGRNPGHPDKP